MISTPLLAIAIAAAVGSTQELVAAPEGYSKVYITSNVNTKFVVQPKAASVGSTLVVQQLNGNPEQQWYIKAGKTKIQLVDTTWCMDAGLKANWRNMANINLANCSDAVDGQKWNAMADGRIALELSPQPQQCLDLQYMRATPGNAVGLYSCAGLGNTGAADKGINFPLVNVTSP
ncbi:hypothetical protein MCOR27_010306 [Pyricularia oryzae]|uniref:Ricin B lectin domain-containing protein n=2 Tax=Pyricularia TaxID=48558 RepID=A0ABQ8N6D8_PYRGI|nr:hypothetical protein MCOR01_001208 [Pyricularia oryzae]KAI6292025.1 hypothetical protein MCOR33_010176 [Pyricularia grisea]KAH9430258.1 hypothetical protein MCOR02_009976 [Pyricularia oryzae]KAI6263388.1 hypothetical protein MCOR19_000509 [Pyricularia oryzae]KAI6268110.1 hypothetical protein MCOR27_010306 [Pyricularia oryzae]